MKVAGIIAEYNPFHNGHNLQYESLRQQYEVDYIIVAQSGNFVQRGLPACHDKYTRAKMALSCGADLVLELPTLYATASAEYFAQGGISLLEGLGVVTHLCFGAECADLSKLTELSRLFQAPNSALEKSIASATKRGLSYPLARHQAVQELYGNTYDSLLKEPNNILALEYLKLTKLIPILIPREGAEYHSKVLSSLASASGIRSALAQGTDLQELKAAMPAQVYEILSHKGADCFLSEDALSSILAYKLLLHCEEGYTKFADCSNDLSARIQKLLPEYTSFSQFAQLLKSKNYTYTRICRVLLHIVLDYTAEDYALLSQAPMYGRILGFRKTATPLLSQIKEKASIPLISKVADASRVMSDMNYALFRKDLFASDLYRQLQIANHIPPVANDFSHPIEIISQFS